MQNWFKYYKMANSFYRLSMSPAREFQAIDMRRWGILHKMLASEVGLDPTDPKYIDKFLELTDVMRELVDRLGRLPHRNEFIMAWRSWLMYKDIRGNLENEEMPEDQQPEYPIGKYNPSEDISDSSV